MVVFGLHLRLAVPIAIARALTTWRAMTWNFLFSRYGVFKRPAQQVTHPKEPIP